jgi:hypothetical protein
MTNQISTAENPSCRQAGQKTNELVIMIWGFIGHWDLTIGAFRCLCLPIA